MIGAESADSGTTVVQAVGGGAVPTSALQLRIEKVPYQSIKPYLIECHYLHRAPSVPRLAFAVFYEWRCVGALVYGLPVARLEDGKTTLELNRFWLADECPKNSESRVLAITARMVRSHMPEIRRLIAYSDEAAGHKGTIYAAAGWRGQVVRTRAWNMPNRVRREPRVMGLKRKWERTL